MFVFQNVLLRKYSKNWCKSLDLQQLSSVNPFVGAPSGCTFISRPVKVITQSEIANSYRGSSKFGQSRLAGLLQIFAVRPLY